MSKPGREFSYVIFAKASTFSNDINKLLICWAGLSDRDVKFTEIHGCIIQLKDCKRDTDQNLQT